MDVTWHPLKIEFNININPGLLRNVLTFNPRFLKGRFVVVQTIENWWGAYQNENPKTTIFAKLQLNWAEFSFNFDFT